MVLDRKYNLVNNLTGWGVFVIALITYWLTLEPTASYWDCGEFIIQADKLEIGHPPGNPIFMLTARFFANFAFGDVTKVPLMVNAMSGLLSALTILLLFWTITHLVRRLTVRDNTTSLSLNKYLVIMGSGVCGALAYTWSDTFWFSAVEGEVYAFSSFCTALVFWLILKWENHADELRSDRYLILIAYIIGVSIAVHLLNLLCIPAIVLVYCYRKIPDMNVKKSLIGLLIGFAIIVFVLYGLVPGFIKVAGWFELFAVNSMHMPFNSGLMLYTILTMASFVWALYELYTHKSGNRMRISFMLATFLSGILFFGSGIWVGIILLILLGLVLFIVFKKLPVRWLNIAMWSIAVIFVGYSSYALILIRSNAHTPMNQNAPNNVFDLSSYLNREQYGDVPLLYGYTYESMEQPQVKVGSDVNDIEYQDIVGTVSEKGKPLYAKGVHNAKVFGTSGFLSPSDYDQAERLAKRDSDFYAMYDYNREPVMVPELNILLPRIHSRVPAHASAYEVWVPGLSSESEMTSLTAIDVSTGNEVPLLAQEPQYTEDGDYYYPLYTAHKPTFGQNMRFFFSYQLNHMYWRYFLWNFAGRQNDICNQLGELDAGNWISGISFIDNARLGDQSLLPPEYGDENPGHNVFYMLPLLLGIIGLLWQAFRGKRGIEQFWVVFFLFFMTGIAIVLYLNQPPMQPRERDYAFAGSFYAFAIWIGMGVAGIYYIIRHFLNSRTPGSSEVKPDEIPTTTAIEKHKKLAAVIACAVGLLIPLQMVSQTWDDHDRSNRYAARDYAINYLNSLEPNAIIFCNGDNDTFPLWYAQEVEGVRPDVKIINLSYLNSEWYANQQRMQTYTAKPVKFTAKPEVYAYHNLDMVGYSKDIRETMDEEVPLLQALKEIYADDAYDADMGYATMKHIKTYIPVDSVAVRKRGLVPEGMDLLDKIPVNLRSMGLGELLMYDIIATNAANGWERPIYWACTVGTENYQAFLPYVSKVGMAHKLVPYKADMNTDTELSLPVINNYLWGGADIVDNPPYFDETAGRMLYATRMSVVDLAATLIDEGAMLQSLGLDAKAKAKFANAKKVLQTYDKRLAGAIRPAEFHVVYLLADAWCNLGMLTKDKDLMQKGLDIMQQALIRFAANVKYVNALCSRYGTTLDASRMVIPAVQLTNENASILNTYYQLVLLYNGYEYSMSHNFEQLDDNRILTMPVSAATKTAVKKAGISEQMLAQLAKYAAPMQEEQAEADAFSADELDEFAKELAKYAEIVVHLQSLTPEEYAQTSEDERLIDSTYMLSVELYRMYGGSDETLASYENIGKIDGERSLRIGEEYLDKHPELLESLAADQ